MKKKVFLVPLAIILLASFTFQVDAEFNINVGEEFWYDAKKWNWDATIGTNSYSVQGYMIDYQHFDEGTGFQVEVISMPDNFSADFEVSKDGYTYDRSTSAFGAFLNLQLMLQNPGAHSLPKYNWNETEINKGPKMDWLLFPFHDTTSADWDFFESTANSSYISSIMDSTLRNYSDLQITYKESRDRAFIERYAAYTSHYSVQNITVITTNEYNILVSVSLTTGVLQGLRIKCSEYGSINGTAVSFKSDIHLEIKGFNLPNFSLGPNAGLPGFVFYSVPVVFVVILIVRYLIRKRRKLE